MTLNTQRNNIKKMLRSITGMMIVLCLFTARALQSIRARNSASDDSIIYNTSCFNSFRKTFLIFIYSMTQSCFAFLALFVTFAIQFEVFT